ncbi:type II toxin-antitoxin system Phd/YefM family antitoxin [Thiohalocapsa sp. ML1]|jgi:antitoxin (DNA-binding transcriptional repressor) of toxin-antitoxin stability system|uniref:type II toxin-antitoxin system Phd/YefM family antitoxin n=1 Tax=Thiohalocapsa sp. ML1 TaxID=1431688 RepID=UPI0007321665|nr:hypothetical protein [Thiohalocapsa sp. ML1]
MTLRIPLQEAQRRLTELVHGLAADDEILIVEDDQEIARIIGRAAQRAPGPRRPGGAKGKLIIVKHDDAHLSADWPEGFFGRTAGALPDLPAREPRCDYPRREPVA